MLFDAAAEHRIVQQGFEFGSLTRGAVVIDGEAGEALIERLNGHGGLRLTGFDDHE